MVFNRNPLFQGFIFRFNVSFRGCTHLFFSHPSRLPSGEDSEKRAETTQLEQASHDQACGRNSETTVPLPSLCQGRRLQVLGSGTAKWDCHRTLDMANIALLRALPAKPTGIFLLLLHIHDQNFGLFTASSCHLSICSSWWKWLVGADVRWNGESSSNQAEGILEYQQVIAKASDCHNLCIRAPMDQIAPV